MYLSVFHLPEENRLSRELLLFRTDETSALKVEVISVSGNMVDGKQAVMSLEHTVLLITL